MLDQAIESRVHVHVQFPPLLQPARSTIWGNFLARLPQGSNKLTPEDLEELGYWNLNGRQIKNALFMTLSWCRQKEEPVTFEAVEDIIGMTCPRASKSESSKVLTNGSNGIDPKGEDHSNPWDVNGV